jgi:predicted  nucleic acid-binding Zn-ribbon protein
MNSKIVDISIKFEEEKDRLNKEIEELRQSLLNQDWYRKAWSGSVEKQIKIMQKQADSLQQIAKHIIKKMPPKGLGG